MRNNIKHRADLLCVAGSKLALNLVHFIESGVGAEFLMDALQEYENARAAYVGNMGPGYQYSARLRALAINAQAAITTHRRMR